MKARLCRLEGLGGGDRTVVLLFVFGGWNVPAGAVQPTVVEPVDPFQGRQLDLVEPAPGAAAPNQLGLEQAVQRLCGGVDVGVPDRADRAQGADFGQPFGVATTG